MRGNARTGLLWSPHGLAAAGLQPGCRFLPRAPFVNPGHRSRLRLGEWRIPTPPASCTCPPDTLASHHGEGDDF